MGGCMSMSIYDVRLAVLEKEVAVMKQDIIYQFDDTNSALTIFKGVVGEQGLDLKIVMDRVKETGFRVKSSESRLARSEVQLEGLIQEVGTIKEQQGLQGQDIKDIKHRLDSIDQRFEQVLQVLATLTKKAE